MTPRDVLEAAAKMVERGDETYACIAIKEVSGMYSPSVFGNHGAGREALGMFTIMFEPSTKQPDGGWWEDSAAGKLKRVKALRHTAAMFD